MKQKINLYLDDLRDCPKGFKAARTVDQAKRYFKKFNVGILSLDHDLGTNEQGKLLPTGYDFVKYICENGLNMDEIYLHTDNSVGRDNMYYTLLAAQRRGFINQDILIYPYAFVPNKYSDRK